MQTAFRQIPKHEPAVSPKEPAEDFALPRPKFNFWIGIIVLIITVLVVAHLLSEGKNQKEYFEELSAKKEAGQYLTSGEESDFCELLFQLRDSVSTECVGILDGINWDNPPKNPEDLSGDWEEITNPSAPEKHRKFRHKTYSFEISFDKEDTNASEKAHRSRGHWHRFNPNTTSKQDYYLDKYGNPVGKRSDESHIHTR